MYPEPQATGCNSWYVLFSTEERLSKSCPPSCAFERAGGPPYKTTNSESELRASELRYDGPHSTGTQGLQLLLLQLAAKVNRSVLGLA